MKKQNWFWKTLPLDVGVDIKVKVWDGPQIVHVDLNEMDVINGKRNNPQRCVGGNGCMRHAKDGTFPHPVVGVWFIKSVAYLLTHARANAQKYSAVRYRHAYGEYVEEFDKTGKWTGPMTLSLYPPCTTHAVGGDKTRKLRGGEPGGQCKTPTGRVGKPKGIRARQGFQTRENWETEMRLAGYPLEAVIRTSGNNKGSRRAART